MSLLLDTGGPYTNLILTTDRKDFSIYRIGGRRAFKLVP